MKHHTEHRISKVWIFLSILTVATGAFGAEKSESAPTKAAENKSRIQEAAQEANIMARVLEEMVDRNPASPWQTVWPGTSAFDGRVTAEYIPAVGAIFTIPVNFPILDPAAIVEQADEAKKEEPTDLWENAARDSEYARGLPGGGGLGFPGEAGSYGSVVYLLQDLDRARAGKPDLEAVKARKEQLREALLTALAQYGHRLKHIDLQKEKIIFIVRSSAPSSCVAPGVPGFVLGGGTMLPDVAVDPFSAPAPTGSAAMMPPGIAPGYRMVDGVARLAGGGVVAGGEAAVNHYTLIASNARLTQPLKSAADLSAVCEIEEHYY